MGHSDEVFVSSLPRAVEAKAAFSLLLRIWVHMLRITAAAWERTNMGHCGASQLDENFYSEWEQRPLRRDSSRRHVFRNGEIGHCAASQLEEKPSLNTQRSMFQSFALCSSSVRTYTVPLAPAVGQPHWMANVPGGRSPLKAKLRRSLPRPTCNMLRTSQCHIAHGTLWRSVCLKPVTDC